MSTFVLLLTAIARAPCFDIRWQYSSQDDPWRFWLHCHDYHCPLAYVPKLILGWSCECFWLQ